MRFRCLTSPLYNSLSLRPVHFYPACSSFPLFLLIFGRASKFGASSLSPPAMDAIKQTFEKCKHEKRAALVAYVTAGYPTVEESVDILLALENGGAGMQSIIFPCRRLKSCADHAIVTIL